MFAFRPLFWLDITLYLPLHHLVAMATNIKNVILVMSGKGGVGKSSITVQLARALLSGRDIRVGVLDIDLCGPSIPRMLGLEGAVVHQSSHGWTPVYADSDQKLAVMSIGFLLSSRDDAVVWRGPKKTAMIKQFLDDVVWPDLDVLLIDTPPGTSDEHMAIVEALKQWHSNLTFTGSASDPVQATGADSEPCTGADSGSVCSAVLVTTPQNVAVADVRRQLNFCRRVSLSVLGVVENMSGFVCPHCSECTNIFSSGGGEELCRVTGVPFLGRVPITPSISHALDGGESVSYSGQTQVALDGIVSQLVASLA